MNNIWKYSLVLSFTIIIDQLIKGTAQSLISTLGGFSLIASPFYLTRMTNPNFIFGLDIGIGPIWSNKISLYADLLLSCYSIWWIVKWRNKAPVKGWFLTFILTALFSSWLDRSMHGHTLDYLSLYQKISFSIADIYLFVGLLGLSYLLIKKKVKL